MLELFFNRDCINYSAKLWDLAPGMFILQAGQETCHNGAIMSQTLTLPDELYRKLAQGAADRGLAIETLLDFVSELLVSAERPTERDRQRSGRIEKLFAKYRKGSLNERDRAEAARLIDADYEAAVRHADRLISAKESRRGSGPPRTSAKQVGGASSKSSQQ
jgi:hypothetical protein